MNMNASAKDFWSPPCAALVGAVFLRRQRFCARLRKAVVMELASRAWRPLSTFDVKPGVHAPADQRAGNRIHDVMEEMHVRGRDDRPCHAW